MGHTHNVYDTDTRFSINPVTRMIKNDSSKKVILIQHDHNSERFTFELPRHIEGHDMSLSNLVEVHYLNIDAVTKEKKSGLYTVTDLHEDGENVVCSWLISQNATSLVGSLNFLLRFSCITGDVVDYAWNTAIFTGIGISDGINAGEMLEDDYVDIIAQWKAEVTQQITKDVNRNITEWAETESGKLRGMLYSETSKTNADLAVERARIDLMQSDATADDAELIDIRVGADGKTYGSAGTAVREQIGAINGRLHNTPFYAKYAEHSGYLNIRTGGITTYADCIGIITDYIVCRTGDVYLYRGTASAAVASVCWYDAKHTFISGEQYETEDADVEITVPVGAIYARFSSFKYTKNGTPILELRKSSVNTMGADARLDAMASAIDALQGSAASLKDANILCGKKWIACGDSYTAGDFSDFVDDEGLSGENSPVIYDGEMGMYKTYPWWIAKRNGMNLVVDAVGGSTMALSIEYLRGDDVDIGYRNPFALERYKNLPIDADYITLMFGLNEEKTTLGTLDSTGVDTVIGAWNTVLEYILTNIPYAKTGIIISDGWTSQKMHDALVSVAEYWGIPYLDLKGNCSVPMMVGGRLNDIVINPTAQVLRDSAFYVSDKNHHPNIYAHKYRSTIIENFLRSL